MVDESFVRGRKNIIPWFLKKFGFAETKYTWQTIRDWKQRFGFPIRYLPNGQPYIIPSEVNKWAITYDEKRKQVINQRYTPKTPLNHLTLFKSY